MKDPGQTVVIVGGGFAGFWAAVAARRVAGDRGEVTLVSREPVLQIRPRLYEAHPEAFGVDISGAPARLDIRFVRGEARGIARTTVVIVGAGFTGIGLALELRNRIAARGGDDAKAVKRRVDTVIIYPRVDASRDELLAWSSTEPGR